MAVVEVALKILFLSFDGPCKLFESKSFIDPNYFFRLGPIFTSWPVLKKFSKTTLCYDLLGPHP